MVMAEKSRGLDFPKNPSKLGLAQPSFITLGFSGFGVVMPVNSRFARRDFEVENGSD
jgi:hypothetical protein